MTPGQDQKATAFGKDQKDALNNFWKLENPRIMAVILSSRAHPQSSLGFLES